MVFRALRRPRIYFGDAQKPWFLRGVGLEGGEKIGKTCVLRVFQQSWPQKTAQIIELNERCSDKLSLISSLESKLNTRNNKVVELQNELTLKETEFLENDAKVREPFREIYLESSYVEREVSNNFSTFWICFLLLCCIINV